jgi:hypothetical protein
MKTATRWLPNVDETRALLEELCETEHEHYQQFLKTKHSADLRVREDRRLFALVSYSLAYSAMTKATE